MNDFFCENGWFDFRAKLRPYYLKKIHTSDEFLFSGGTKLYSSKSYMCQKPNMCWTERKRVSISAWMHSSLLILQPGSTQRIYNVTQVHLQALKMIFVEYLIFYELIWPLHFMECKKRYLGRSCGCSKLFIFTISFERKAVSPGPGLESCDFGSGCTSLNFFCLAVV